MIISASRRTDIPAFYAEWFMNRVRKGFFYRVNPFNSRQVAGFSLKREDVDAVCFWTKNPRPLMSYLDELDRLGLNYYFQFTLNPYDATLEPNIPPLSERIATFGKLAERIGPEKVIWRYDPVILSGATPVFWHLEQAAELAGKLQGSTRRMVFSFCNFYGKGDGRLHKAMKKAGVRLEEITAPEQRGELERIACGFRKIADAHGMEIFTCSEEVDLASCGIGHGACIDGELIRKLFGGTPSARKDKSQRKACRCVESVDMGSYNSCYFGCAYCYANFNEGAVEKSRRSHDPESPVLLGSYEGKVEIRRSLRGEKRKG
jgi:DNA repair photolyase